MVLTKDKIFIIFSSNHAIMEISIPVFKLYRQLKLLKKQDCVVLPLSLYGQSDNVIFFWYWMTDFIYDAHAGPSESVRIGCTS